MQNRYTGDIGDFAKYGILRTLAAGHRLGVAWYLYPDELHNFDGKHTAYLNEPEKWRHLDSTLFDALKSIVTTLDRNVNQIERSQLLENATFSSAPLAFDGASATKAQLRTQWFSDVLSDLDSCNIVFADPDNGLCEDSKYRKSSRRFWKRIPLFEALTLADGRMAIIYHHNTHRRGGHALEIQYWLGNMGSDSIALYWRAYSNRTYFIMNPTTEIKGRAETLARKWSPYMELHTYHGN